MNKRGQFFLMAALVISGILLGFATLYTVTQSPKEDTTIYDLSSELNYENSQVIDQGVFNNLPQDQINQNLINLTNYYANQNPANDLVIVYGNSTTITVRQYISRNTGNLGISTSGGPISIKETTKDISSNAFNSDNLVGQNIQVTIDNQVLQSVKIVPGQNFYSVIKKSVSNQTYVASGGLATNSQSSSCLGQAPTGNGVISGSGIYSQGSNFTSWSYVQFSALSNSTNSASISNSLGSCRWTCNYLERYVRDGNSNKCER